MPKFRISIGRLLGWVALIAVSLAALREGSELWTQLTLSICVGFLTWASLQARYAIGRDADWWFGFALLGWLHLVSVDGVISSNQLLSDSLLEWSIVGSNDATGGVNPPDWAFERLQIAHNLTCLVAGWLGGWGVMWYAAWHRRRPAPAATAPSGV